MVRKGLSKEIIVDMAISLIKEQGYRSFSMRMLAEALDVKPASLYKHFKNFDDLLNAVGIKIYERFDSLQEQAITDARTRQEAVMNLAMTYRDFAFGQPELYRVVRAFPKIAGQLLPDVVPKWIKPMKHVMELYDIDEESRMHWQRIYRATITGFLSGEGAGLFVWMPVSSLKSYQMAIMNIIAALESLEREQLGRAKLLRVENLGADPEGESLKPKKEIEE